MIYFHAFSGLLRRDLRVLMRQFSSFLLRTLISPVMFVFVFTYVFPRIGQGISSSQTSDFGTVLLPGLVAMGMFFQGIMAVALPLAVELDATHEIHDRIMAPIAVHLVAIEKICFSALQSVLAAAVIFPMVYFIPATPVHVSVSSWGLLTAIMLLTAIASGAVGLTLGTLVKPRQISLVFSTVLVPITFLGCVYYPWAALHNLPWLQYAVLLNPLVYMSEGLRVTLTSRMPHMPVPAVIAALSLAVITLSWLGIRGFARRIVD